jgi:hypothetical protein
MAMGALFVGWGPIITGRERKAAQVLGEAMQYLGRLRGQGVVQSVEVAVLEPHGGDLGGFVLVKGEKDAIARLRVDDEFVRTVVGVQLVHEKVGVVGATTGDELEPLFGVWDQQEARLL